LVSLRPPWHWRFIGQVLYINALAVGVEILTILITVGLTWGAMNLLLWALKTWHWDSDTKSTSKGGEKDDKPKGVGANLGPNLSATTGATVGISTATATKATTKEGDDEEYRTSLKRMEDHHSVVAFLEQRRKEMRAEGLMFDMSTFPTSKTIREFDPILLLSTTNLYKGSMGTFQTFSFHRDASPFHIMQFSGIEWNSRRLVCVATWSPRRRRTFRV
jgi:hypothetical protein